MPACDFSARAHGRALSWHACPIVRRRPLSSATAPSSAVEALRELAGHALLQVRSLRRAALQGQHTRDDDASRAERKSQWTWMDSSAHHMWKCRGVLV